MAWFKDSESVIATVGYVACVEGLLLLLVWFPQALHRRLPWHSATKLARTLLPSWLAATAAVITWIQVVLLHVGGKLPGTPLAALLVAGLGVALLLVPLYQFVARSFWEYGVGAVLDPVRWHAAWREVYGEVRRSFGSGCHAETTLSAKARDLPTDSGSRDTGPTHS
jgi:hypothetical protein